MALKMVVAQAGMRGRTLTKGDVGNAYTKASKVHRSVRYMDLPSTLPMTSADGTPLCIELHTPIWGEAEAGYEWQVKFASTLDKIGWLRSETVPALYTFAGAKSNATLITIVDDFLISESQGYSIADKTIVALKAAFGGEVQSEHEPTSFAGYKVTRDMQARTLNLSMPQKVTEAARAHAPVLLDGGKLDLPKGKKLMDMADALVMPQHPPGAKLGAGQIETQQIIGSLKFIEKTMPKISLPLHRLSCIMAYPPPEAKTVALAVLAIAYKERDVGITYGGDGPDADVRLTGRLSAHVDLDEPATELLEAAADASWGDRMCYGMLITFARGAVYHCTKKIGLILDSSMEAEAVGTSKAGEASTYAREILRAIGEPTDEPTLIHTDNDANMKVANDAASAARSKHFLRRYWALQQRMARGEVRVVKVGDPEMSADFLTKWLPSKKLTQSLHYATNSRARPAQSAARK
jgi:hypothetical protein